jgi:1-acyl-sn-glycerol-3-phosphate acyltransferase
MNSTATARNLVGPLVRLGYRVRISGTHHCPRRGAVIVAAPYLGVVDPSVIATCLPRPVDVLVDVGALSAFGARLPGRITITEAEPETGMRLARDVLDAGGAVGAWCGDGREGAAGYLAVRVGAPILPVAVLGGSGGHPGDPPAWRSRVDVVVGPAFTVDTPDDPWTRASARDAGEVIRQRVADHLRAALVRTGRTDGVAVDPAGPAQDNGAS